MAKIKNKVDRILPYFKIMNGKIVYNGRTRSITKGYSNMAFWINGKIINCNINTVLIQYYKFLNKSTVVFPNNKGSLAKDSIPKYILSACIINFLVSIFIDFLEFKLIELAELNSI